MILPRVHPIISTSRAVSRVQIFLESVFAPFGIWTLPIVSSRRDEQVLLIAIAALAFTLNVSSLLAGIALVAADREAAEPLTACAARCSAPSSESFRRYSLSMTVGAAGTAIALVCAIVCANRRACHAAGRHHALLTVLALAQMGLLAARATAAALAARAAHAFAEGPPPFVTAFDAPGPRAEDGLAIHVELMRRRAPPLMPAPAPPVPLPQPRRVAPARSSPRGEGLDDAQHRRRSRPRSPVKATAPSADENGAAHTCAVCLEVLSVVRGHTMALPCGHAFCTSCIQPWLREHNICPTCRHPCE